MMCFLSCGGSSFTDAINRDSLFPQTDTLPEKVTVLIDDYADTFIRDLSKDKEERRDSLFSAIRNAQLSNYEKAVVLDAFSKAITILADSTASLVDCRLQGIVRDAYHQERAAFGHWRENFIKNTLNALLTIRELESIGGTAGSVWLSVNEYDWSDMNYLDMKTLLEALDGKANRDLHQGVKSVNELDSWLTTERENCMKAIQSFADTESVIFIPEGASFSVQELYDSLDCLGLDVRLFKEWIGYREAFSRLLPKKARNRYERMTNDILRERLATGSNIR